MDDLLAESERFAAEPLGRLVAREADDGGAPVQQLGQGVLLFVETALPGGAEGFGGRLEGEPAPVQY
ncbi:MAG: hypothetical protein FJ387_30465, partial [Verrucomicrobia bacterium]|nr:hypothetical protein [Verrucomicrobiota bacterium]